jgi:hypothetical protein
VSVVVGVGVGASVSVRVGVVEDRPMTLDCS